MAEDKLSENNWIKGALNKIEYDNLKFNYNYHSFIKIQTFRILTGSLIDARLDFSLFGGSDRFKLCFLSNDFFLSHFEFDRLIVSSP